MALSLMNMKNPSHPGKVFKEMYLKPLSITLKDTAVILDCSQKHISNTTNGKVGITADMATRIAIMTNTSAKLWLGMQNSYDLAQLDLSLYKNIKCDLNIPTVSI
jgi:addiction module HigA family antidote